MISVVRLKKNFDGNEVFGDDLSFDVPRRSICAIVGPTGCGKSTIMNLIAGLDVPDSGTAQGDGPGWRIGYMMQEPSLLPWRTLEENATLGVEIVTGRKPEPPRLRSLLEAFELWRERGKYPAAASGGMKQKLALVRTLMIEPSLLLLDEPFANLDFDIKLRVQRYLLRYQEEHDTTILWVTHDIEDAIAISNSVIVLSEKPTVVKARIAVNLGLSNLNPGEARKSSMFREYFAQIWDQLRYLDHNDG